MLQSAFTACVMIYMHAVRVSGIYNVTVNRHYHAMLSIDNYSQKYNNIIINQEKVIVHTTFDSCCT